MIIEKSVTLPASREEVWKEIEDMGNLILCMPGVQNVEDRGDDKWGIVITQKIGFISITFDAEMKVTNMQPPNHLETATDATARRGLGKAFQNQSLDLEAISDKETLARYKADVALVGKIGTFGQRVLGGKVGELATKFIDAFTTKLTASMTSLEVE